MKMNFKFPGILWFLASLLPLNAIDIYVTPGGTGKADGSSKYPFHTIEQAPDLARNYVGKEAVNIHLNDGIYYLEKPLTFTTEDGGTQAYPVYYQAVNEGKTKGKKRDGTLDLEGGWQNNRPDKMHERYRFIEHVFEELDAPGEDTELEHATLETVSLRHLIEFKGSRQSPVKQIHMKGLVYKHTARTFMENKEPLLRSDWTTYRGGAVFFEGAENCSVLHCEFDQVGGNSIFVNNYNRNILIRGCYIHESGANGVAFVGDPDMVRDPLFRYGPQDYKSLDLTPGPKGDNFPSACQVRDCIITLTGRTEKQTAPIQISMSQRITISHCSIYDVPRAGINISEGTFGGHVIEYCDVFNTVLETGDHGSFNSWGRDRFWDPDVNKMDQELTANPDLPSLDMMEPNVIRNNRWRCDHGWDVDLDDGSSNYQIYNNLLLNGGLKLREGYHRTVTNNIMVNNGLHPHVWPRHSEDVVKQNIFFTAHISRL